MFYWEFLINIHRSKNIYSDFNNNPFIRKAIFTINQEQIKIRSTIKKQRNFFVNLLHSTKKDYFQKLNVATFSNLDEQIFCKYNGRFRFKKTVKLILIP